MKEVEFSVGKLQFVAIFSWNETSNKLKDLDNRIVATCTLVTMPDKELYSGSAICHPNDKFNEVEGERIAFARAVANYVVIKELDHVLTIYEIYQKFRVAMGEVKFNKYYKIGETE